ncbi:hypothetical protein [Rhodoglobus sp.]
MMTRLVRCTLIAFGIGALSFLATAFIANYAHSNGTGWGSVDGMTPMWPVSVGLAAMSLMALSVVALLLCVSVGLIRESLTTRQAKV